jgi:hypothetical protein
MIRSNSMIRVLALSALALLSSACRDDRREAPVGPVEVAKPEAHVGTIAYLTISDSSPKAGSSVRITGYATGTDVTFGSFAARLTFAPAGLTYVGETGDAAGMRAINAKSGEVAIAGVNLEGFTDGQLFSVEMRVDDPRALSTLALSMSELTGLDYKNERASLSIQKSVRLAPLN